MRFAYWQPPPQGIYHGKLHIALVDGESEAMLCGKRVTSSWSCVGRGRAGKAQQFEPSNLLYSERRDAWQAGVNAGRASRIQRAQRGN